VLQIHHVNLQTLAGGGEMYTLALSRALVHAGVRVHLYVHPANRVWESLSGEDGIALVPAESEAVLLARLPVARSVVLTQSGISASGLERLAARHLLAGFAHMPMHGRSADEFRRYHLVLTVSRYCIGLLRAAGIERLYPEPLYGMADLGGARSAGRIVAASPYDWDRRKVRDRLFARVAPLFSLAGGRRAFERRPGLTLGLVSLISPIKQFPLLFSQLAPILARRSEVNLEIFGAGGYAQVRDLHRALRPLGERVRWWGYQKAVASIYPQLDYLMTGLPEKEALGLNVIEAQACGTPVLAPEAPPFTETVLPGTSGFLYRDPRLDEARDFAHLIDAILAGRPRPDPRQAEAHLARFSQQAFLERTRALAAHIATLAG
jgi:glycosyltransferase involved in cell wall biosynthesis